MSRRTTLALASAAALATLLPCGIAGASTPGRAAAALPFAGTARSAAAPSVAASPAAAERYVAKPVRARAAAGAVPGSARRPLASGTVTSAATVSVHSAASRLVVSPHPRVYLVFWGSQWSSDPAGVANALRTFYSGLYGSADNWSTVITQYCEGVPVGTTNCGSSGTHIVHPTSSPLAGTWFDNGSAQPSAPSQAQISAEATRASQHFNNTTALSNENAQYVIVSPTGTQPYLWPATACGWHSSHATSTAGTFAYVMIPYIPDMPADYCAPNSSPGRLDGLTATASHEFTETATDFVPGQGWYAGGTNGEIGDLCQGTARSLVLTTGTFVVQGLWSNSANACRTSG